MSDNDMKVAILGTGIMGSGIGRSIARAGLDLTAWNRTRERAEPLAEEGAKVAASPEEAVREADVVVTMLTDTDAVAAVMEQGLPAMRDDAVWAQMSTVGIAGTERLATMAEQRGVAFVDAPVSGTREPAEQGKLVILASGPRDALARCAPVFDAAGQKTLELGDAGAGTRMKLVTNNWLVCMLEDLAETIAFAQAIDVDPSRFLDAIDGGPMGPPYARLKGDAMIAERFTPASFPLKHARKDAALVLEAAQRHDVQVPLAEVVTERFDRAIEMGHGDEDMAAAYCAARAGARR